MEMGISKQSLHTADLRFQSNSCELASLSGFFGCHKINSSLFLSNLRSPLAHSNDRNILESMDSKFRAVRNVFFELNAMLLFVQAAPLPAQQIPTSELPPPGTDTGLDGKYDPQNGVARLIRGEDTAVAKIFEGE